MSSDNTGFDNTGLDALRSAWSSVAPPERPDELSAQDVTTRAAVGWIHAQWSQVSPPLSEVPRGLARHLPRRRERRPVSWRPVSWRPVSWRPLAAAAVLLAILGGPLLLGPTIPDHSGPVAPADAADAAPTLAAAPRVIRADGGSLELISGPVRLLLLTPQNAPR